MGNEKHVEMLANGLGSEMLDEIVDEVDSIESTLENLSISVESLRPESQFAIKRMKGYIQEAERISSTLFNYERRVGDIKRSAGVKDIVETEENINSCCNPTELNRLKRKLTHLKSIHARKLSDLVSNEQQLLQERLRLINIWKSILNYEIHILEECKTKIVQQIVAGANSSGDAEIIEMVRNRLGSLSVKDSIISELKMDMGALKVANIHILHKTLNEQLNDIDRIETAVKNKKQIVEVLNRIVQEIRRQIPNAPSGEEVKDSIPSEGVKVPPPNVKAPQTPDSSRTRMAFHDKK